MWTAVVSMLLLCGAVTLSSGHLLSTRTDQAVIRMHQQGRSESFPFNNVSLSWDERVNDLVQRLTLEEITQQMALGGRETHAPGVSRLGVPPYPWGSECLRGDVDAGPATSFPQAIGLAAMFSPELVFAMARATGVEVRAKYNNYSSHGDVSGQHKSASCWSPVINVMRDPRWGRNQETYGEDPWLSGVLAAAYVRGLQGDDPRYVLANAGCKHFDVYAGPENIPSSRHSFDAKVSMRDWRMTFLPAFRKCVEAGSLSLMCSYNRVNGVPACANKFLLTDVLRGEWGFNGYVISDEGAIEDIMDNHKYAKTKAEAAAAAVNAGCNLEDGPGYKKEYFFAITDAVQQKLLDEATVREAVKPLFYTRMRLGLFDPPSMVPYSRLAPEDVVQSAEHRNLSLSLALNSFVLLKNSAQFLPLKAGTTVDKVAILGPMADNVGGIFGEYAPSPDPKYITTPLKGLQKLGATSSYAAGCSDLHCGQYSEAGVKKAVTGASLIVVCLGTGAAVESESNDRADIALPGKQLQLLQDAARYGEGAPVVLLLFNAGPLDVRWALASPRVPAIVACFFPAQATGDALYRMFFNEGRHGNPAGRLPATWPQSLDQVPDMTDYSMVNRTYRYIEYEPLFPFGYGLSYTTFQYRELSIRPSVVKYDEVIKVDVFVTNIGPYDGDEVVQLYVSLNSSEQTPAAAVFPRRQLVGFRRVFVPRGEGRQVALRVRRDQLAVWDDSKGFVVLPGTYTLYAGGQQPGQKVNVGSNILEQQFQIST